MLIKASTRKGKRFMATFANGKIVHFGNLGSMTYIDHGDKDKRTNYLKRHAKNENWNDVNAGSLSRYLLWDGKDLEVNRQSFMKRFPITTQK